MYILGKTPVTSSAPGHGSRTFEVSSFKDTPNPTGEQSSPDSSSIGNCARLISSDCAIIFGVCPLVVSNIPKSMANDEVRSINLFDLYQSDNCA